MTPKAESLCKLHLISYNSQGHRFLFYIMNVTLPPTTSSLEYTTYIQHPYIPVKMQYVWYNFKATIASHLFTLTMRTMSSYSTKWCRSIRKCILQDIPTKPSPCYSPLSLLSNKPDCRSMASLWIELAPLCISFIHQLTCTASSANFGNNGARKMRFA